MGWQALLVTVAMATTMANAELDFVANPPVCRKPLTQSALPRHHHS